MAKVGAYVRLMTGIDTAMPDIKNGWSYHAEWNHNDRLWPEDFRQLAGLGFDLLRWGAPWSLVEPEPGVYRWDLIDPQVELASKLGLEIFYPIVHFNYPKWVALPGEKHAVVSHRLTERLESYTERLLDRYGFKLVTPIVEVAMEAYERGLLGKWQPHLKGRRHYDQIWTNLLRAFRASARVARRRGATVVCSEPAPDIKTVRAFGDTIDLAGIDLYPHIHRERSILGYLRQWSKQSGKPLCLSEFGTPETFNPEQGKDVVGQFVQAGLDDHRVMQAKILAAALAQAEREGIEIPIGGWYPGTGNIGWGYALTRDRSDCDCDRAGLVDLARQPDGSLKRVLCRELAAEILGLRDIYRPAAAAPGKLVAPAPVLSPALVPVAAV